MSIRIAVYTHCQMNENHVQIRRFACYLNMGLNLKIYKMSPALFAWRYYTESITDQTEI